MAAANGWDAVRASMARTAIESGLTYLLANWPDYSFHTQIIPGKYNHLDEFKVKLSVFKLDKYVNPPKQPIFEDEELAWRFISEEMLTKIILVCGGPKP